MNETRKERGARRLVFGIILIGIGIVFAYTAVRIMTDYNAVFDCIIVGLLGSTAIGIGGYLLDDSINE